MKRIHVISLLLCCFLWACTDKPDIIEEGDPVVQQPVESNTSEENTEPDSPTSPEIPAEEILEYKKYEPIELTSVEKDIAQKVNSFSWRLIRDAFESPEVGNNANVSPLSTSMALALMANGANDATLTEIMGVIGLDNSDIEALNSYYNKLVNQLIGLDNTVDMELANSIWCTEGYSFTSDYADFVGDIYNAQAFQTTLSNIVNDVNTWCSDKTHGIISEIIGDPTEFSLANALYFKGNWTAQFDKQLTDECIFHCYDGTCVNAAFMHQCEEYVCGFAESHTTLSKSFGNGAYNFVVILPDEGHTISECLDWICTNKSISNWSAIYEMQFSMPRFKANNTIDIKETLRGMGLDKVFDNDQADFSRMTTTPAYIRSIKHAVSIEVDEGGAVTAAATAIEAPAADIPDGQGVFNVNRPFIYAILENSTQTPIIIGKIERM